MYQAAEAAGFDDASVAEVEATTDRMTNMWWHVGQLQPAWLSALAYKAYPENSGQASGGVGKRVRAAVCGRSEQQSWVFGEIQQPAAVISAVGGESHSGPLPPGMRPDDARHSCPCAMFTPLVVTRAAAAVA